MQQPEAPIAPAITPAGPDAPALTEPILRSIPEWFGIESATLKYIADTAAFPTWIATLGETSCGFLTINRHFPGAAEIHCIAVHKDYHGRGIGTALLAHVEEHLRCEGVHYLQVKTMGPSRPCPNYAMTLRFYRACGFEPLEEIHGLWPDNPALLLIKSIQ